MEFGKRRPVAPASPSPPVKRSGHVALLLMGTMAVGGGAYAVTQRQNCQPNNPGMAAPSSPGAAAACTSSNSSSTGGHGFWGGRRTYFGGDPSPSSGASTASGVTTTTRGGFGSFARSIAGHFSGS
jgi:hypothetical protein